MNFDINIGTGAAEAWILKAYFLIQIISAIPNVIRRLISSTKIIQAFPGSSLANSCPTRSMFNIFIRIYSRKWSCAWITRAATAAGRF